MGYRLSFYYIENTTRKDAHVDLLLLDDESEFIIVYLKRKFYIAVN